MRRLNLAKIAAVMLSAVITMSAFAGISASAEWSTENENLVYIGDNGKKLTGWQTIGGKKYYFDDNGYARIGWMTVSSGTRYYFRSNGVMNTGWLRFDSGAKYYFDDNGRMVTGWEMIGGSKYYFNADGTMKTGWLKTTSGNRYFTKSGKMAVSCTVTINGKSYKFNENGKITAGGRKPAKTPDSELLTLKMPEAGSTKDYVKKYCGLSDITTYKSKITGRAMWMDYIPVDVTVYFRDGYSYRSDMTMDYTKDLWDVLVEACGGAAGVDYKKKNGQYVWTTNSAEMKLSNDGALIYLEFEYFI